MQQRPSPEDDFARMQGADAQTDDARLTLCVARTAVLDHGAVIANYAPVSGVLRDGDGKVAGVHLDVDGGIDVRAGVVVNAAGVWSDHVRALDEGPSGAPREWYSGRRAPQQLQQNGYRHRPADCPSRPWPANAGVRR